jgi:hypothetical protein
MGGPVRHLGWSDGYQERRKAVFGKGEFLGRKGFRQCMHDSHTKSSLLSQCAIEVDTQAMIQQYCSFFDETTNCIVQVVNLDGFIYGPWCT